MNTNATVKIVDAAGGGDYLTIKDAVNAALGVATSGRWWEIRVRNGTYYENNITGVNYVSVIGESRAGVQVITDGLSTNVNPDTGLTWAATDESVKRFLDNYRTMTWETMTITANNINSIIHADSTGTQTMSFTDMTMILNTSGGQPVALGLHSGQTFNFTNCHFENNVNALVPGVYVHNWDTEALPVTLNLINCTASNAGLLRIDELGSEQVDNININNCSCPVENPITFNVLNYYWSGGGQPYTDIPYSWRVNINGGSFAGYPVQNIYPDRRPNLSQYITIT